MPKSTNPVKVIREKCLDCCCGSMKQVELCPCESNCPLWPFRFGKNPFRKKVQKTEEQKARFAASMSRKNGAINEAETSGTVG